MACHTASKYENWGGFVRPFIKNEFKHHLNSIKMNINQKIEAIKAAIYWESFTPDQLEFITELLSDDDIFYTDKANDICDYLEIPRRGNRQSIIEIIVD